MIIARQRWLPTYMCFYYHHLQSYSMRHHIICTLILEPVGPVTGTLHGDGHVCVYMCVFVKVSMKRSYNRAVISTHTYTSKQERGAASASDFPEVQIAHPQMHPGYVEKQHG